MKKIILFGAIAISVLIASCSKDENVQDPVNKKNDVQISDISSIPPNVLNEIMTDMGVNIGNKPDSKLKVSRTVYGNYPFLVSTGTAYQYLSAKTYAVKMTRSFLEGTNYYSGNFQAEGNGSGTLYVYLFDQNWNRLLYNSYQVNSGTGRLFDRIPLSGSNQLVVFFTANVAGNYITWIFGTSF